MYIGIKQSEASALLSKALASAGLRDGDGLMLFGSKSPAIMFCCDSQLTGQTTPLVLMAGEAIPG
jgi:hypothetical protein